MRLLLGIALAVPLAALAGCGPSASDAGPTITTAPRAVAPLSPGGGRLVIPPTAPPTSGAPGRPGATVSPACREVVAGIDAYNLGDYDLTVAHFKKAVPLAKAAIESDDSRAARDLLDAVLYYSRLKPAQYPMAAGSSLEFAKYKAITLGQCEPVPGSGGGSGGSGSGDDGTVAI